MAQQDCFEKVCVLQLLSQCVVKVLQRHHTARSPLAGDDQASHDRHVILRSRMAEGFIDHGSRHPEMSIAQSTQLQHADGY